ncbi:MAG: hypothetical protein WC666_02640 [Candidatus Paceibacterota bacterium]|jgi:hypothetical protein
MLELDNGNPTPFKQPFLCLKLKRRRNGWYVDVDGMLDLYVTHDHKPTPLLIKLCARLRDCGYIVTHFGTYKGSAGPSHILRAGYLFVRMSDKLEPRSVLCDKKEEPTPGKTQKEQKPLELIYTTGYW